MIVIRLGAWWVGLTIAAIIKACWGVLVIFWLAAQEPFWHQLVIVMGGSLVTAIAVIVAALITTRRIEKPVAEVKQELVEHRHTIEGDEHEDSPKN